MSVIPTPIRLGTVVALNDDTLSDLFPDHPYHPREGIVVGHGMIYQRANWTITDPSPVLIVEELGYPAASIATVHQDNVDIKSYD